MRTLYAFPNHRALEVHFADAIRGADVPGVIYERNKSIVWPNGDETVFRVIAAKWDIDKLRGQEFSRLQECPNWRMPFDVMMILLAICRIRR